MTRRAFRVSVPSALIGLVLTVSLARPSGLPPHGGSAAAPQQPKAGKGGEPRSFEIAPGVKMVFCYIPPGKANLGSPPSEPERSGSEDEREYTTKGFWFGKYEVTQREWAAVMGSNPSYFDGKRDNKAKGMDTSRFPVDNVSWNDCHEFLARLNDRGGAEKVFGKAGKFVLPHEDEWEYACRGGKGNKNPFYFGKELNGTQANHDGTTPYGTSVPGPALGRTTTAGSYEKAYPHPWGLCDLHGNVDELCENKYRDSSINGVTTCGGSYFDPGRRCRAAYRIWETPTDRKTHVGFRVLYRTN